MNDTFRQWLSEHEPPTPGKLFHRVPGWCPMHTDCPTGGQCFEVTFGEGGERDVQPMHHDARVWLFGMLGRPVDVHTLDVRGGEDG